MTIWKRLRSRSWFVRFVAWSVWQCVRFVYGTNRWTIEGEDIPEAYHRQGKPFILAFWHSRLMIACYSWDKEVPIHMIISEHADGKIISFAVGHYGIKTIAGSKTRRGAKALRKSIAALRRGDSIGITPDGPRGPREEVSEGICQIARLGKCDIIPLGCATSRHLRLGTWDRFFLSLPFGRGAFVWGEPLSYGGDIDILREQVKKGLDNVTHRAESLCHIGEIKKGA
ncbi:MAG: lysophospholipid acyltransferase family protein [bacterium]|nr:lysophospholipid acyltransferase family protein [bacterium]